MAYSFNLTPYIIYPDKVWQTNTALQTSQSGYLEGTLSDGVNEIPLSSSYITVTPQTGTGTYITWITDITRPASQGDRINFRIEANEGSERIGYLLVRYINPDYRGQPDVPLYLAEASVQIKQLRKEFDVSLTYQNYYEYTGELVPAAGLTLPDIYYDSSTYYNGSKIPIINVFTSDDSGQNPRDVQYSWVHVTIDQVLKKISIVVDPSTDRLERVANIPISFWPDNSIVAPGGTQYIWTSPAKVISIRQSAAETYLNISPTSHQTDYNAQTVSDVFRIFKGGPLNPLSANVISGSSWITASISANEDYLVLELTENTTDEYRWGTVEVTDGTISAQAKISQVNYLRPQIIFDESEVNVAKEGGTIENGFQIVGDIGNLRAFVSNDVDKMIDSYSVEGNTVVVVVKPNTENPDGKRATITVIGESSSHLSYSNFFTIYQERADISVIRLWPSKDNEVSASGERLDSRIETIGTVGTLRAETSESWLSPSISTTGTDGNPHLYIDVSSNSSTSQRTGSVLVTDGNTSAYFNITQLGSTAITIILSPDSSSIPSIGGSVTSTIITTGNVGTLSATVTTGSAWITASISGNTLTVTGTASSSETTRYGVVRVSCSGSPTAYDEFNVSQAPPEHSEVSVNPNSATISSAGGTLTTNVSKQGTVGTLRATISRGAEYVDSVSLNSSGTVLTVVVSENTTTTSRIIWAAVGDGNYSDTFVITQEAAQTPITFSISPTSGSVDYKGGYLTTNAVISGNASISYTINTPSVISSVSKSGNRFTITVSSNPGESPRTGTVTFYPSERPALTQVFTVSQGGHMGISTSTTTLPSSGAEFTVNVESGQSWRAVELGGTSLLTFSPSSGTSSTTQFRVSVANNTSKLSREISLRITSTDGTIYSNTLTLTQNGNVETEIIPAWRDTFCEFNSPSAHYVIKDKYNTVIFEGVAQSPVASTTNINVSDIVSSFLTSYMEFKDGIIQNAGDDLFSVYQISGNSEVLQKNFRVHNDWTYDPDINYNTSQVLSEPINGHFDYRQFIPFTTYNTSYKTYTIKMNTTTNQVSFTSDSPTKTYGTLGTGYGVYYYGILDGGIEKAAYKVNVCGKKFALVYRNRRGGWDSFLIEGGYIKTDTFENDSYLRRYNNNITTNFGTVSFHKRIKSSWKLTTGWLNDSESERFAQNLLPSPEVYLQDLDNEKFYAVIITDTQVEHKTFRNQDRNLVKYEMTIEDSQPKNFL